MSLNEQTFKLTYKQRCSRRYLQPKADISSIQNDHCCSLRNLRGKGGGGGHTRVLLVIQLLVYMKYSNYLFSLNSSLAGGDPHQKTLLHKKKKKVLSSKLKFQNLIFQDNDTYFKLTYFLNLIIKLEEILQSSSWYTAVIRRPQKPLSSNKH